MNASDWLQLVGAPGELGLLLAILWRLGKIEGWKLTTTKRIVLLEVQGTANEEKLAQLAHAHAKAGHREP